MVRTTKTHCHEPEAEEMIRRGVIEQMKKRVVEEPEKSTLGVYREVLNSSVAELRGSHDDGELGVALPSFDSVSSILHRSRENVRPPLPETRREIDLTDTWTRTRAGGVFLQIDDVSEDAAVDDRMLGFASDPAFEALCSAQTVFMDGTFRIVPLLSALYPAWARWWSHDASGIFSAAQ